MSIKSKIVTKLQPLVIAFVFSIIVHIIFVTLYLSSFSHEKNKKLNKKNINIIKFKTIGIKNGANTFSEEISQKNIKPNKRNNLKQQQNIEQLKKLGEIPPLTLQPVIKNNQQVVSEKISPKKIVQLQQIRQLTLSSLSPTLKKQPILQNTGFFFKFIPPKGMNKDELNSIEKTFYSFQKRTYHSYVSSLLKYYSQLILRKPYIQNTIFKKNEILTGRLAIDREGNIVRVSFIKSSNNEEIQKLFEQTLTGIQSLPNPPRELLKNEEELNIYFQLVISDN